MSELLCPPSCTFFFSFFQRWGVTHRISKPNTKRSLNCTKAAGKADTSKLLFFQRSLRAKLDPKTSFTSSGFNNSLLKPNTMLKCQVKVVIKLCLWCLHTGSWGCTEIMAGKHQSSKRCRTVPHHTDGSPNKQALSNQKLFWWFSCSFLTVATVQGKNNSCINMLLYKYVLLIYIYMSFLANLAYSSNLRSLANSTPLIWCSEPKVFGQVWQVLG